MKENTTITPPAHKKVKAENLDDVLEIIDDFILRFKTEHNALGYFTSIYKLTTLKVREVCKKCDDLDKVRNAENSGEPVSHDWIDHEQGQFHFDDTERMKEMVVIFANRYFDALRAYSNKDYDAITGPWKVAIDYMEDSKICTTQHFFISANAHINLDLGIAAAQVCAKNHIPIKDFEDDFNTMNEVLASLYEQVNLSIALIWGPFARLVGKMSGLLLYMEDKIMEIFREGAWTFTEEIYGHYLNKDNDKLEAAIKKKAEECTELGSYIAYPTGFVGFFIRCGAWAISWNERHSHGIRICLLENSKFITKMDFKP